MESDARVGRALGTIQNELFPPRSFMIFKLIHPDKNSNGV